MKRINIGYTDEYAALTARLATKSVHPNYQKVIMLTWDRVDGFNTKMLQTALQNHESTL